MPHITDGFSSFHGSREEIDQYLGRTPQKEPAPPPAEIPPPPKAGKTPLESLKLKLKKAWLAVQYPELTDIAFYLPVPRIGFKTGAQVDLASRSWNAAAKNQLDLAAFDKAAKPLNFKATALLRLRRTLAFKNKLTGLEMG